MPTDELMPDIVSTPPPAGGGILVVDDTPSALHLMVEMLGRAGYAVRPALSGELAVRSALRNPPELILLDVQMPGMDGFEVCRRLKADSGTAAVPVIFLSALSDTESRVRGLEVGGQDFISKPVQREELLARVRTHLMLGRAMSALDQMCVDLQQRVVERSTDVEELSSSLAEQVAEHHTTARRLQLASRAIDSAHDAIIVADSAGIVTSANPACVELTGFTVGQLMATRVVDLFERGDAGAIAASQMLAGRAMGEWAGEVWIRGSAGAPVPVWMSIAEFREDTSLISHFVLVFSDLSQRKESEAKIRYLAEHDLLTGLPNRVLLNDRFNVSRATAVRQHEHLALLFIDVDKFKTVNDALGHGTGDAYLQRVASALKEVLRASDALCRVGGDEFLALITGVRSVAQVSKLAERIRNRLDSEFVVDRHPIRRTVSIGIAMFPDDGEDFDELASKADTAMYLVKRAGRNSVLFHTEQMNIDLQKRIVLEDALRAGIFEDQLFLRYQPQVDLQTGAVVGLEALVRWNRPNFGEVQPGEFIAVAEDSGLILDVGVRTVGMACAQAKAWMDEGIAVPISVNVSPVEIHHGDVDTMIQEALERTGLPGSMLIVEVTETGLVEDSEVTRRLVARLRDLGVRLSIDDFLTGYSNFTYLRQFEPLHLKIDRSFVESLAEGAENLAIVRAAIQMADVLGIPTIAEGVETELQAELLRDAGCQFGQGFLFARPLTAGDAHDFLTAGQGDRSVRTTKESHERS
jgi:diguanylate cyclase (GGDEF)-like protein/PAS domain S-box-containing protein